MPWLKVNRGVDPRTDSGQAHILFVTFVFVSLQSSLLCFDGQVRQGQVRVAFGGSRMWLMHEGRGGGGGGSGGGSTHHIKGRWESAWGGTNFGRRGEPEAAAFSHKFISSSRTWSALLSGAHSKEKCHVNFLVYSNHGYSHLMRFLF